MSVEEAARAEVERRHPAWHDNGVGIVQGSHYRTGFVAGAVWQAGSEPDEVAVLTARLQSAQDIIAQVKQWNTGKATVNGAEFTRHDDLAAILSSIAETRH